MAYRQTSTYGFKRTATVLGAQIRRVGESRGFAVSRVLTHWAELVGEDIARIAHPVNISYGKGGFGATLTVLTTGAQAPMLEMQKEQLRERVNAAYGYNAVSRVRITQTAATGFAEGQAAFAAAAPAKPVDDSAAARHSARVSADVQNDGLRQALEKLGRNVLTKQSKPE